MAETNPCLGCCHSGIEQPEREIFFIGGSPCCGKSAIAQTLAAEFGFYYHREDDFLEKHINQAVAGGAPVAAARMKLSWGEAWAREPKLQSVEEIVIYQEIFPYVLADLAAIPGKSPVITEAAAYMPELMYNLGVHPSRYICMCPTDSFAREHYAKREWVWSFLSDSADPDLAFDHWMTRDTLFGQAMREQTEKCHYHSIIVDGSISIEDNCQLVKEHFLLTDK